MANYQTQHGKSIDEAFIDFHKKNPKVWETFLEQTLRAIRLKRTKISAKHLLGYIRWHVSLQINSKDEFKINDAYTSRYARMFAKKYPQHQDIFNYRDLRSGPETITKKFLTKEQISVLKKCHRGYIVKVGNSIHVCWMKDKQHPVDKTTFNRLVLVNFIAPVQPTSRIQKYKPTKYGKNYLKSIIKNSKVK